MKITFLVPFRPSRRDALVWGFDRLRARGFDVSVLCVGPLLGATFPEPPDGGAAGSGWAESVAFSEGELETLLDSRSPGYVVDYVVGLNEVGRREARVFEALDVAGVSLVVVHGGAVPTGGGPRHLGATARKVLDPARWANLVAKRRIARDRAAGRRYARPDWIFAGSLVRHDAARRHPSAHLVPVNSFDFDRYLDLLQRGPLPEPDGTVLFLDEGLTDHADWAYVGLDPLPGQGYYRTLRRFFDRLEATTGLCVRIAGHPKVDYDAVGDVFGGREIRLGTTIEDTARASGVIATATTAVSFATLLERPIMIIVTDGMRASGYVSRAIETANALGVRPLDIDDETELRAAAFDPTDWSREGLAGYRDAFVVDPDAPRKNMWEVVADELLAEAEAKHAGRLAGDDEARLAKEEGATIR